ncbi:dnaJ homolog subfamily B member 13-like [Uranotaenia lowii]|uniref:dnaJ homolog subfamily B member 13-like n=1 Tax=Uranotaenia lowii TaxID=190385 RepID=UPI002479429D|nr:dnaJ homolog subfamily B member 13-like [Uranotaenia lowii]
MGFDYYAILNVPRTASEVEIKLAYRKYAVRCHPHNTFHDAPELPFPSMSIEHYWELLNEAFEVLSDPLRKEIFDIYGEEGLKKGVVTPKGFVKPYFFDNDCMRIYKEFFATFSPYGDLIDSVTSPPPLCNDDSSNVKTKGPDIEHVIELELEEIFHGALKKMQIVREEFLDEAQVSTTLVEETLKIHVPAGISSNARIRFPEAGDCNAKTIPSDVVFVVQEKPHARFTRSGQDLHLTETIFLEHAMLGFRLEIPGIDGRTIVTQIVDVIHPGYIKVLKGEGLPFPEDVSKNARGDLHVTFKVVYPDFIPKAIREKFRAVFEEFTALQQDLPNQ